MADNSHGAEKSLSSLSSHTPGPWHVEKDDYGTRIWATRTGPDDKSIASLSQFGPDDQRQADAHLIAAAPDLLHALYCITTRIHEDEFIPTEFTEFIEQADAAINAALGLNPLIDADALADAAKEQGRE